MDVELVETVSTETSGPSASEPPMERRSPTAVAHRVERRASPARVDGSGPTPPVETSAPSSEPGGNDETWAFSPTTGAGAPGPPLSGKALDAAVRAGVRATVADARDADRVHNRQLLPTYGAREVELGLAPGGAFATITKDLVRRSRVPTIGSAFLRLDTDAAGVVTAVLVLDASAGRPEWAEVAAQIAAEARAKPARVPAGARGVSVWLEVTSAMRTVDGGTPTNNPVARTLGVILDPPDALLGAIAHMPLVHVVKARVVEVQAF
jgi:hypothetical protein